MEFHDMDIFSGTHPSTWGIYTHDSRSEQNGGHLIMQFHISLSYLPPQDRTITADTGKHTERSPVGVPAPGPGLQPSAV